jgi:UTP:GlnB (protein PII) uridylyltransferase
MVNPRLTLDQLGLARALLDEVRARLVDLSGGDKELIFDYRRELAKELSYDERSKPMERRRLKRFKMKGQGGICPICPICNEALPERGAVLDRVRAIDGYTLENTRLIQADFDNAQQAAKGYA